jgi:hypothetical protein
VSIDFLWYAIHVQICDYHKELTQESSTAGATSETPRECANLLASYLGAVDVSEGREREFEMREKTKINYGGNTKKTVEKGQRKTKETAPVKQSPHVKAEGKAQTKSEPRAAKRSATTTADVQPRSVSFAQQPVDDRRHDIDGWCIYDFARASGVKNKSGAPFACHFADRERCPKGRHGLATGAASAALAIKIEAAIAPGGGRYCLQSHVLNEVVVALRERK